MRRRLAAEFDYIVVGAGAAGCVVAARLSQDRNVSVLLIEAGGADRGLATRIPMLTILASARPRWNWSFVTEPVPALGGRTQIWNQGRLLGGSSSINGMIYMRGHPGEYDAWEAGGCAGWGFDDLLPYFKRSESNSRGEGRWHGGAGPVKVRPCALDLPLCDDFLDAVRDAGFPIVEDLNAGVIEGFGRYDCNIDRGRRASAARAYLHPAIGRPNLSVATHCLAARILIERGRAQGVEALSGDAKQVFRAAREVILCGGAINSPALLMASGIGPADHLAEIGIPVVAEAPEVGANLRNHPAHIQQYHCTAPVSASAYLAPRAAAKAGLAYLLTRKGPLAESFLAIGGFMRSDPALDLADTIVVMIPSLMQRSSGAGARWRDIIPREHGFSVVTSLGRPRSSGWVRLRSTDPRDPPRILPATFDDQRDVDALARSVERMRLAMRARSMDRHVDHASSAIGAIGDGASIEREIRETAGTLSHPTGSCRMGNDTRAVVDPALRVNGIEGLRVADNSIIPHALNACTHAVALMIGEKASALIAGQASVAGAPPRMTAHAA